MLYIKNIFTIAALLVASAKHTSGAANADLSKVTNHDFKGEYFCIDQMPDADMTVAVALQGIDYDECGMCIEVTCGDSITFAVVTDKNEDSTIDLSEDKFSDLAPLDKGVIEGCSWKKSDSCEGGSGGSSKGGKSEDSKGDKSGSSKDEKSEEGSGSGSSGSEEDSESGSGGSGSSDSEKDTKSSSGSEDSSSKEE